MVVYDYDGGIGAHVYMHLWEKNSWDVARYTVAIDSYKIVVVVWLWKGGLLLIDFQWHHFFGPLQHFCRIALREEADLSLTFSQALQAAVQKIHTYVATLEEKVEAMEKKKK